MQIILNGEPRDVHATLLPDILNELGFGDARVATAVNEEFVAIGVRGNLTLKDGDRLEVVAPMQGG